MKRLLAITLVAGCTSPHDVRVVELADLTQSKAYAHIDANTVYISIDTGSLSKPDRCAVLAGNLQATYADQPVFSIEPGGTVYSSDGVAGCDSGALILAHTSVLPLAPDAQVVFRLYDGTDELRMTAIGPGAPRTITADGGNLVPGTMATLRWSPATDTVFQAPGTLRLDCSDRSSGLTILYEQMTTANTVWTFTVPATSYRGSLDCHVLMDAPSAGISECGFGSCAEYVDLGQGAGAVGTFSFELSI